MSIFDTGKTLLQNSGKDWSYEKTDTGQRYELRSGDSAGSLTDRSESESAARWSNSNEIHLSYKFMIEEGSKNSASWLLAGQFFSSPGAGGKSWSPPFAVELAGENMRFMVRSSTDAKMSSNPIGTVAWKDSGVIDRGHWYNMDIAITFDPFGNGKVVVVRDGAVLFTYNGAVGYVDTGGYYWKEGLYRSSTSETIAGQFAGTEISYASGSPGKIFDGTSANDTIWGSGGDDLISGGAGDDKLYGHAGNDTILGGDGNDVLSGMSGADKLDGGAGVDTADYSLSSSGVSVSLATALGSGGDAEGDTLINIESLIGSNFGDVLIGNAQSNGLYGGAGNDILEGGAGGDFLYGDAGNDTAVYKNSGAGVAVDLTTGTGKGGDAQGDRLYNVENIEGSKFADKLSGNDLANLLTGGAGNDVLNGGAGNDTLDGGSGNDVLIGGKGNDIINGGDGQDVLVLAGNSKDYVFKFRADGSVEITDKVGSRDGIDVVNNVEALAFRDGSAKIGELRNEFITKNFDKNSSISSYDITVTTGNKVEYKHYDANWKLVSAESTTTNGNTQIVRTWDSKWNQTSVTVNTTDKNGITSQLYDAKGTTLLSATTTPADGHVTKTVSAGLRDIITTYDKFGVRLSVDVEDRSATSTTIKHYDGAMKLLSNSLVQYGNGFTDHKEYDASWNITSFNRVMSETLNLGTIYKTGGADALPYQDVHDVLTHATDDPGYLVAYGHHSGLLA